MDTLQIEKILRRNPCTRPFFVGCYPSDMIPTIGEFPHCMVANTDPSHLAGTHWTAIYVPSRDVVEFYDSFGDSPNEQISRFLAKFERVRQNSHMLQSPLSSACGRHAIYFLIRRCGGARFSDILNHFRSVKSPPDRIVDAYVYSMLCPG